MVDHPGEEEEDAPMPGWGHWAMPVDQELHQGEFMTLNDIMAPMDDMPAVDGNANSSITISDGPSHNSANTSASANGPLAPIHWFYQI